MKRKIETKNVSRDRLNQFVRLLDQLPELTTHLFSRLISEVIRHDLMPETTLRSFLTHPDKRVRISIVLSRCASQELICELTRDKSSEVRAIATARFFDSKNEDLLPIAKSNRIWPKLALLMNPKFYPERAKSAQELNIIKILRADGSRRVRAMAVAADENATDKELMNALKYGCVLARIMIACRPNITDRLAILIANDESWEVKEKLCHNRKLSEKVLNRLKQDPDNRVRFALAHNRS